MSCSSYSQLDSTMISKSIRLLNDYKACKELNDSMSVRIDALRLYKRSAEESLNAADSVIVSCSQVVSNLSEENVKLSDQLEKKKKNRKWWVLLGIALGLSTQFLF